MVLTFFFPSTFPKCALTSLLFLTTTHHLSLHLKNLSKHSEYQRAFQHCTISFCTFFLQVQLVNPALGFGVFVASSRAACLSFFFFFFSRLSLLLLIYSTPPSTLLSPTPRPPPQSGLTEEGISK